LRRRSASALSRLDGGVLTSYVEKIAGGFKVIDANGQSLAYVYSRETKDAADIAKVLTDDEARRIASNIAKLPTLWKGD
jgi:hypothetical protein